MDNSLSHTKTTSDHEDDGYHRNDLTTRQKEIVREKRVYSKNKSRQRVLCFIFDCGCDMIYVSFIELNLRYYVF